MRPIISTNSFKRDLKREMRGKHAKLIKKSLETNFLKPLQNDIALDPKYRDHGLKGKLSNYRDVHIKDDLVLIYRKTEDGALELFRLGSHQSLGM